ncbi:hypothetical protein [Streptomyces sp. NPDC005125]
MAAKTAYPGAPQATVADITRSKRTNDAIIDVVQDSTIKLEGAPVEMTEPIRRLTGQLRTKRADHVVHGSKTLIAALLTWGIVAPWSPDGRPYMAVATALLMSTPPRSTSP